MTTLAAQYQKYKSQSVCASTPGEQIVLLFEQAIVSLSKAAAALDRKDVCGAHNAITHVQDIYLFLSDHLDMHYEISQNLFTLYQYIYDELVKANIKKDKEPILRILEMTRGFRDTWKQAETLNRKAVVAK